jgi:hypothetical protein
MKANSTQSDWGIASAAKPGDFGPVVVRFGFGIAEIGSPGATYPNASVGATVAKFVEGSGSLETSACGTS